MIREFTEIDKARLTDLIVQGYSRTQIAKKLKTKNTTLEKLCLENKIPLIKKGNKTFIKDDTDGILIIKGKNIYFKNSSQLYFLLNCEFDSTIRSVEPFQETFKIIKNDSEIIIPNIKYHKCTCKLIENAVEQQKIKFFNAYYNKKFKIKYEL